MKRCLHIAVILSTIGLLGSACQAQLAGLDAPKPFQAMRTSSTDPNWRNGNGDSRIIEPRTTMTIAEMTGPGRINHIWFSISTVARYYPRAIIVRIYWDGEKNPSVEAPLGDLFAVGHGLRRDVNSAPVSVMAEGRAYNSYWPMPFRKSAKITISNDADQPAFFFWQIDWAKLKSLPRDTMTFHAQYRQETPCKQGEDYLILDTRGRGHYVGTVLSARMNDISWFGEGDDRFYIDGETEPSIRGTGTEDYFGDCWAFREFQRPYSGVTIWEGSRRGDRGTAYRWHIQDPVPFTKSLRVTIEHKGANTNAVVNAWDAGFGERSDDFSSVAFWYQTGEATRFSSLPANSERMPSYTMVEAESLPCITSTIPAAQVMVQESNIEYSGGKRLLLLAPGVGASISFDLQVATAGIYALSAWLEFLPDGGTYDIYLDGAVVAHVDTWKAWTAPMEVAMSSHQLMEGLHSIKFVCIGTNPRSMQMNGGPNRWMLGIDSFALFPITVWRNEVKPVYHLLNSYNNQQQGADYEPV